MNGGPLLLESPVELGAGLSPRTKLLLANGRCGINDWEGYGTKLLFRADEEAGDEEVGESDINVPDCGRERVSGGPADVARCFIVVEWEEDAL